MIPISISDPVRGSTLEVRIPWGDGDRSEFLVAMRKLVNAFRSTEVLPTFGMLKQSFPGALQVYDALACAAAINGSFIYAIAISGYRNSRETAPHLAPLVEYCARGLGRLGEHANWIMRAASDTPDRVKYEAATRMGSALAAGDTDLFDDLAQVHNGFALPSHVPLVPVADLRRDPGAATIVIKNQDGSAWDEQLFEGYVDVDSPHRRQMARIVVEQIGTDKTCLEIGSYKANSLLAVEQAVIHAGIGPVRMIGIEPGRAAVAYVKDRHRQFECHIGSIESLASGALDDVLPGRISVVYLSAVVECIAPAELDRLLTWLSIHADRVVIMDDIANMNGDVALQRAPDVPYVLHPFRRSLESHGFVIERAEVTAIVNRAYSGIIVARNMRCHHE